MLPYTVNRYGITVELSIEEFETLDVQDFFGVVMPQMANAGAMDIEYNGHFGPHVFFDVGSMDDVPNVIAVIEKLVKIKK